MRDTSRRGEHGKRPDQELRGTWRVRPEAAREECPFSGRALRTAAPLLAGVLGLAVRLREGLGGFVEGMAVPPLGRPIGQHVRHSPADRALAVYHEAEPWDRQGLVHRPEQVRQVCLGRR